MKHYFGAETFNTLKGLGLTEEQAMIVHNSILREFEVASLDIEFVAQCLTAQMIKEGKKEKSIKVSIE